MIRLPSFIAVVALVWAMAPLIDTVAENPTAQQIDFFESEVRPLLIEHCYECHSTESGESGGGLLLDSAAATLKGGSLGPALQPGDAERSLVVKAISYSDPDLQMPPDGRLDRSAIDVLRHWIEMGAPDPRDRALTESSSPLDRDPATHWAFVLPTKPTLAIPVESSALDPIDSLVDQSLRNQDFRSAAPAEKETLVRRLHYDLTGLPPSVEVIEDFVDSDRTDAYGRLVDQLLATPDFGQRFARHWMDVSRYANTVGYVTGGKSREYEGSERFRDWAIHAYATDMPYDEMILHQLSGDRTDPNNENGNLDAMGFLSLGRRFLSVADTRDDQIDVMTRGLLGMTVACARCHDHKFDPIPTADYYSLFGIIASSEKPKDAASPLAWTDKSDPADQPILIRGQQANKGPLAVRQFLTALRKPDEPRFTDGSGRWELAQRIASADNPLTSRVMVNRIWGYLIGVPLVATPSDFGFRTKSPAIPELLDELAVDFSEHWSVKKIVRRIVLSRTYRQSTDANGDASSRDPDNRWLTRANRKRRDFESLRDSVLSVSHSLDRSIGGKAVKIDEVDPNPRRTIYAYINRQNLPAVFRTFDFASPDTHSPQRYYTTVPQQALFMMNNPQILELSRRCAARIRDSASSDDPADLVLDTFRQVLGRNPSESESERATLFLKQPVEAVEPEIDPRSLWSYGTASLVAHRPPSEFATFAVFQKDRWQTANEFPAPAPLGHACATRSGGHPANESDTGVVRRFTAPTSGVVTVAGKVGHSSDQGDGVQISVWIGQKRVVSKHCKKSEQTFNVKLESIQSGQTIDFVVGPGESSAFDSFSLAARIQLTSDDGTKVSFGTKRHYAGPIDPKLNQPLDSLAQLVQTLMMTNEFAFVD